ncbi:U3 snoRNP protein [Spiromyces aspiralis]|uniref:U3 snoRNP protein n=1 Tax=Spiromyces aspiralis TaxID=68401 RepID=A0ACC1HUW1_9FUNG|nr:U3 snoRNP protein [Spiromyces aspiralis]
MRTDFKASLGAMEVFSNLCGTVYKQGNLVYTLDGNSILSPVGNRVTVFDLVNNKAETLPFENRKNIEWISLTPNGNLLLTIDEGRGLLNDKEIRAKG